MPIYQVWVSGGGHAGEWEYLYPDEVEKRADGKLWTHEFGPVLSEDYEICDSPPNQEDCEDIPAVPGIEYTYRVRAVNGNGPGPVSDAVTGSPVQNSYSSVKPVNLMATAGNGQVTLSWNNPNDSKTDGYLFRVGSGTDFGPITHMPNSSAATTSHTVTGLANNTEYRFVIAALSTDTYHTSKFSDTVTATPTAE